MLIYHVRFLFHVAGMKTLNLPYCLLESMKNMSVRIQNHTVVLEYSLYHQALIKVLVEKESRKINKKWDHLFLNWACQPAPTPPISQQHPQPAKRTKRKAKKENIHKAKSRKENISAVRGEIKLENG